MTRCLPATLTTAGRARARPTRSTHFLTHSFIVNTPALTIINTTKHLNDKRRKPVVMNSARKSTDYISSKVGRI